MKSLILCILMVSSLCAQKFFTVGAGYSGIFYSSDGLENFRSSYNDLNRQFLIQPMEGIDDGMGLRVHAGYRELDNWTLGIAAGYQEFTTEDIALFNNGEKRKLKYDLSMVFLEAEAGKPLGNFFINVLGALFVNRKNQLKSTYEGSAADAVVQDLSGAYKSEITIAADAGISFGYYRDPIFLILRFTVPVYTGGSDDILRDESQTKIRDETDRFPADYISFVDKGDYSGVTSDIDGIKITFTLEYALRL